MILGNLNFFDFFLYEVPQSKFTGRSISKESSVSLVSGISNLNRVNNSCVRKFSTLNYVLFFNLFLAR